VMAGLDSVVPFQVAEGQPAIASLPKAARDQGLAVGLFTQPRALCRRAAAPPQDQGRRDGHRIRPFPPKPDPTGLITVARALQIDPAECVYIGDGVADFERLRRRAWPRSESAGTSAYRSPGAMAGPTSPLTGPAVGDQQSRGTSSGLPELRSAAPRPAVHRGCYLKATSKQAPKPWTFRQKLNLFTNHYPMDRGRRRATDPQATT